ncbi:energy-coupling factor ABC transporter ATP-binding protein [Thermomonospora cellulosilytica]|uniref:ABC transporter ATP-binding protein n=1 Tax=Thermomonospora cellulosilytica TaxID=1411118 RepID=A0A7W3MTT8_9ACTN|nr:ATP-binding cassette domain-containing protein [Thermomonospora cellulosilytica]MBA9001765.1 cobalt/nickel transport system ATP-binding protein [Thermomonospora cellulosilytica]
MTPILSAREVSFAYDGEPPVFGGLSLEVPEGRTLALLGPNGVGKTTLLRLLTGGLRPSRGQVLWRGSPVSYSRRGLTELRTRVQLVLQDPDDQLFSASVVQDVSFGPLNLGLPADRVRARVAEALAAMEIADLADRPTHLLSFGQRKRVAIAGALALRPAVLVLDEPTAGLDPAGVDALLATLAALQAAGTTIVASTHDVDLAHRWADDAAILAEGHLHTGRAADLLTDEALLRAARLRPAWGPAVGRVLRRHGVLPPGAPDPRTPADL